jgi:hypothetical protein
VLRPVLDSHKSSIILEHRDYAESIGAARDNIKIQKKATSCGVEFVLLGLEGQEHIHYAMPMRVMGYDYGSYKNSMTEMPGSISMKKGWMRTNIFQE